MTWQCGCGHELVCPNGDVSVPPFHCVVEGCACEQCTQNKPWEDVVDEVDLDGHVDERHSVTYMGKARRQPNGKFHVLAKVQDALCKVEVRITFQDGFEVDPTKRLVTLEKNFTERYPEHEKLKAVRTEHRAVCVFLEWLDTTKEYDLRDRGSGYPITQRHEALIAEFFEIDMQKFEQEKVAMLEKIRSAQETPSDEP